MKLSYPGTISTITRTFDIRRFASLQSTYVPPLGSSVLATIFLLEASAGQCYTLRLLLILATFIRQMAIETTKFYKAASATGLQRPSVTPTVKLWRSCSPTTALLAQTR